MDFLLLATRRGLVRCSTDNGAGGLSSSIGELATDFGRGHRGAGAGAAEVSGAAAVGDFFERVAGAVSRWPWSRTQAATSCWRWAREMEVELSDIGALHRQRARWTCALTTSRLPGLALEFLHDGVPRKVLEAEYVKPARWSGADFAGWAGLQRAAAEAAGVAQHLLARGGDSAVRPRGEGAHGGEAADGRARGRLRRMRRWCASILRAGRAWPSATAFCPGLGDLDAYQMSAGSFDEAVRQIISVGGRLPNLTPGDGDVLVGERQFLRARLGVRPRSYQPRRQARSWLSWCRCARPCAMPAPPTASR